MLFYKLNQVVFTLYILLQCSYIGLEAPVIIGIFACCWGIYKDNDVLICSGLYRVLLLCLLDEQLVVYVGLKTLKGIVELLAELDTLAFLKAF